MAMVKTKKPEQKKTQWGHLATGFMAGCISRTLTSPLERLRILQ